MMRTNFYECQELLSSYIENKQKKEEAAKAALNAHITQKRQEEYKHSFDIDHQQRKDIFYSWQWAKNRGYPINTFLQWEFEFNPSFQDNNASVIRSVAHHVLMFMRRNGKIPSHVIWSRFVTPGSNRELCSLICHVPSNLYEDFKKYACKWDGHHIEVNQCSYSKEWDVGLKDLVTVFDIVFKAASKTTQYRIPNVYCEESDIVFRPRVFCSEKLNKEDMAIEMKAYAAAKEIERLSEATKDRFQQK